MKAKEAHKLSDEEVKVESLRLRKRMFELRTQSVTEKIQDTSQFPKLRRDIARLATEVTARRARAAAGAAATAPAAAVKSKPAKSPKSKAVKAK